MNRVNHGQVKDVSVTGKGNPFKAPKVGQSRFLRGDTGTDKLNT